MVGWYLEFIVSTSNLMLWC